ncbi:hypothetical protein HOY80DRAFT_1116530 [Tuber brumale]|nr:hypothetical protein HOY80DRAFT_1116530 [Tuber brumale]
MPPLDHSLWHDTFIYASNDRDVMRNSVACGPEAPLQMPTSIPWWKFCVSSPILLIYMMRAGSSITVNNDVPLIRSITLERGRRVEAFRIAVRARDGGCVITGFEAPLAHLGNWRGFDACHIFPLAYEQQWKQFNYGRWITVPPANESDGSINSVQNGILLASHMHRFFDCYEISINPKDNYKFVCFSPNLNPYLTPGRSLDQTFLENPLRPPDQLLRWHFRHAVLINMKGAGGHPSGDDFPLDPDAVGGVVSGERAGAGVGGGVFGGLGAVGRV